MEFKIKSITDVITNSSTEVFTIYNNKSIDKIKELFNTIIGLTNSHLSFDELFEVEFEADEDRLSDYYDEYLTENNLAEELLEWNKLDWRKQQNYFENLSKETKQRVLMFVQEKHYEEDNDSSPLIDNYIIKVKDNLPLENKPYIEKVAKLLSGIDNIFLHEERCC